MIYIAEFVLVSGDFMREWLETPKCWKWRSFTKVTIPVAVRRNSSYDELDASVMQSGNLDYGFRPILRINVAERFVEGLVNSLEPPPLCLKVDDDSSDYENDDDQPINTKDDPMHMEEVSLDSQVEEEYRGTRSQPGHSFNDGANFHLDQTFADKKELKMLLDAATVRQCFDYCLEKNCYKFLKAKCLSRSCGWLLRAMKYETSCRFCIYKYVGLHTCGVEHATYRHKRLSSKLIASLCNIIRGTPEHGYACLPVFSHIVELLNPGSSYSIMYGGVLLSAVAQDTENHIFPIVFCVVDKEKDASWTFFFQKLKSIIEDEPNLCVISDRYIIIANAFSRVYSRAHHGLCMRHLAENLRVNQYCEEHLYLFYTATKAYTVDEFSKHFSELKNNSPEAAH
ncbi:uncharacterized protein LOC124895621, partial [Capsicum annuum]|uniref:uncharacterized protein LOC124895621 n=1 Tax=Capsicum annuum TaxID=4072 RepID=UPI001FB094E0